MCACIKQIESKAYRTYGKIQYIRMLPYFFFVSLLGNRLPREATEPNSLYPRFNETKTRALHGETNCFRMQDPWLYESDKINTFYFYVTLVIPTALT